MAVVTIIGVFVALAMPGMAGIMGDRHAARAADDVSAMFRIARSRAIATGAAHVVQVTDSGSSSKFVLRTTFQATNGPLASCLSPRWDASDSLVLQSIDFAGATGSYGGRDIRVTADGTTPKIGDYCFTPGGTSWWRNNGTTWMRPRGVEIARWQIARRDATNRALGLQRTLRLAPNGTPAIEAI